MFCTPSEFLISKIVVISWIPANEKLCSFLSRGESHTLCVIMTQRNWPPPTPPLPPPPLAICVISRFSANSIVFQKNFLNTFRIKKESLHLWRTDYFIFNCLAYQFLSSSFDDYSGKQNPAEEITYLKSKIQAEQNTTNIQTAPDYSSVTAIMSVMFWTKRDFCVMSDCRNSFNNVLNNLWTSTKFL